MKKKHLFVIVLIFLIFLMIYLSLYVRQSIKTQKFKNKVESQLINNKERTDNINTLFSFKYDYLYSFAPYLSKSDMEKELGFHSTKIRQILSEGNYNIVFVKDNKVVLTLYGSEQNGYFIDLPYGKYSYEEIENKTYTIYDKGQYSYYKFNV